MDSLVDFSPVDTSMLTMCLDLRICTDTLSGGFINIQAIRLKKYGMQKQEAGEGLDKA